MNRNVRLYLKGILFLFIIVGITSCGSKRDKNLASTPGQLQNKVSELIQDFANSKNNTDSFELNQPEISRLIYNDNLFQSVWSQAQSWHPLGDSLFKFISRAQLFGLFPEDYHFEEIKKLREKFYADSSGRSDKRNPALWAEADILLTDAFAQIVNDVKLGRLPQDSISLRKDSVLPGGFFLEQLKFLKTSGITAMITSLEPRQRGYHLLKAGINKFLESAEYKTYTLVPYPEKDQKKFNRALQKRLFEGGFLAFDSVQADSVQLTEAVKNFQKKKGITVDGRAGEATVRLLNVSDREKFIRIAISLDKYKMLPDEMPSRYIWVNASANTLELIDKEEVKLKSRVICGKPKTRTPLLNSQISELITYPQWIPPPSIVSKEILPSVRKNPGYLARRGFKLMDWKGNQVDPFSVNWSKYKFTGPYYIVQGSGDANALGIMKFVFSNKYSVYLHDTNQRYLFSSNNRSLSHGCVRVQEWEKLTHYILRYDSLNAGNTGNYTKIDSVKSWLRQKKKKSIAVRNKIPVYIRYFTCEGEDGNIVFFDDVYSEDKLLREKYFAGK